MDSPRLMDQMRLAIRRRHYSHRTEKTYVHWCLRYIRFHGRRHPRELSAVDLTAWLNHLANERHVAASTQNQALSAILFLYKHVLSVDLPWLEGVDRARRPDRLPVVLTRGEARAILDELSGTAWIAASLLYGSGLRVSECQDHDDLHARAQSRRQGRAQSAGHVKRNGSP